MPLGDPLRYDHRVKSLVALLPVCLLLIGSAISFRRHSGAYISSFSLWERRALSWSPSHISVRLFESYLQRDGELSIARSLSGFVGGSCGAGSILCRILSAFSSVEMRLTFGDHSDGTRTAVIGMAKTLIHEKKKRH